MIRRNQNILSQIYAVCDFLVIQLIFVISWWYKFESPWIDSKDHLPFETYFAWSLAFGVITLFIGIFMQFYSPKRKKRFSYEALKIIQVQMISFLVLLSGLFFFKAVHISREFLAIFLVLNIFGIGFYRYGVKLALKRLREKGYNKQFMLIIGAGSLGRRFYDNLQQHPELGFEIVGFLDDFQSEHEVRYGGYKPILGKINELEYILHEVMIDEVIIALPLNAHEKFGKIISICEKAGIRSMIIPDFYDYLPARPHFDNFAGIPLINVRDIPLDNLNNRILKRLFDIVFSSIAIIITLPLMVLVAIGIKLSSPGPIIFKQERVGLNRRSFPMYKFRSMKVMNSEIVDKGWTVENDPRRTKFGAFLRKTSLDELPQFFNVIMGHMSVVGPRPERPYYVDQFKEEIPKYMVKHHIRPGITGWAQSNGLRGDTSIKERITYDIFYIENWTFLFDIKIIYQTIWNGLVNKNAY